MAHTATTKEVFPGNTLQSSLDAEIKIRLKAGAAKSWIQHEGGEIVLYTEWQAYD